MINYNDLKVLAVEGQSQRSSKHSVMTDTDSIVITSTKFKEPIALPIDMVKTEVKTVEIARQVLRGICKRNKVKYNSSFQNVADKLFDLLSVI